MLLELTRPWPPVAAGKGWKTQHLIAWTGYVIHVGVGVVFCQRISAGRWGSKGFHPMWPLWSPQGRGRIGRGKTSCIDTVFALCQADRCHSTALCCSLLISTSQARGGGPETPSHVAQPDALDLGFRSSASSSRLLTSAPRSQGPRVFSGPAFSVCAGRGVAV